MPETSPPEINRRGKQLFSAENEKVDEPILPNDIPQSLPEIPLNVEEQNPPDMESENPHVDIQTTPIFTLISNIEQFPSNENNVKNVDPNPVDVKVEPIVSTMRSVDPIISRISSTVEYASNGRESKKDKMLPTTFIAPQSEYPSYHDIEEAIKQLSKISKFAPRSTIFVQGPAIINQLRKKKHI